MTDPWAEERDLDALAANVPDAWDQRLQQDIDESHSCPVCGGTRTVTVPDQRSSAWFPRPPITTDCPHCTQGEPVTTHDVEDKALAELRSDIWDLIYAGAKPWDKDHAAEIATGSINSVMRRFHEYLDAS